MNWLMVAWIAGGLSMLQTLWMVGHSRMFPLWKGIVYALIAGVVLLYVVPQANPWLVFLSLAAFNVGVRPLDAREPSALAALLSLGLTLAVVVAGNLLLDGDAVAYGGDLGACVRQNVAGRWEKIVAGSVRAVEKMRLETRSASKAGKPAPGPSKAARKELRKVRELLLPVDCEDILAAVDDLDAKIERVQKELVEAEGARVRHPEEAGKYDARVEAVRAKKASLETERGVQAAKVMENLRGMGLNIPGDAADRCLFPVNVETLIDNAIVAKDIAEVVEQLGRFMASEDLETAKRYFGMYLVMIEVQAESYRMYLEKSENGEWRQGITSIRKNAEAAALSDEAMSKQARFKDNEREIFRKNAATNRKTVEAADAYLDMLRQHETVIRGKLAEAERIREVAQSSWTTVNLASDLLAIVKTSNEAFQALLSLELPPLMLFDDTALQAEFDAITRKLRKE